MQNEYNLSIITINYNGLKDTCALLETIPTRQDIETIVVDNASYEDEASIIEGRFPHVRVIRSNKNHGFAGGNNLGIEAAHGKYLFFINNDTVFEGEWKVDQLISRIASTPNIGMVCPKIRFAWGMKPIQFAGYTPLSRFTIRNRSIGFGETDQGQYDTAHRTPYAHGAAMLTTREAIAKVGLMPECYFLYYEELDWSMMFTRAGYEIWYDPSCTIYHKESQTTGQNSPLRTYYITRNRLIFAKRNLSGVHRLITYLYLTTVVMTRDLILNASHGRIDIMKATLHGAIDFLNKQQGYTSKIL